MGIDGGVADAELLGDLLFHQALAEEREDFHLAIREDLLDLRFWKVRLKGSHEKFSHSGIE